MQLLTVKVTAMLTLGLGSYISGMIPACFSEGARQRHPLLMSCLLCFGGGVLLSTSLAHMLPEAREKFPKFTELVFCVGFFLVYLVDELVHLFYGPGNDPHRNTYGSTEGTSLLHHEAPRQTEDGEMADRCCGDTANPRMCHVSHTAPCNKSSSGVIGLLCALFVHSVLEGLAIGLQENPSQVLLLLGAVASHKFVVGFCLGAELAASTPGLFAHQVCVLLFSGGSVAGIGIGTLLESVNSIKDSVAIPVMQALAAGTLLYVTVSEVLPRERAHWHERARKAGVLQFVACAIGFTVMYITTMYLDHD